MRTYERLLKTFWGSMALDPCTSTETAMYLYLLHQCFSRGWVDQFEVRTTDLAEILGVDDRTVLRARKGLRRRGLINFTEGTNRRSRPSYSIFGAEVDLAEDFNPTPTSTPTSTPQCRGRKISQYIDNQYTYTPTSTPTSDGACRGRCRGREKEKNKEKENFPPHPPYKEKENKKEKDEKLTNPAHVRDGSQFEEIEGIEEIRKIAKFPPSLDDVKMLFFSRRADKRVANWEELAETFYSHYSSLGWKTSAGAEILNWGERVNLWILKRETPAGANKPITADENIKADRFSERRGTEPSAKSHKGFKGTF